MELMETGSDTTQRDIQCTRTKHKGSWSPDSREGESRLSDLDVHTSAYKNNTLIGRIEVARFSFITLVYVD